MLSLGYAEGPPALMQEATLTGGSTVGLASQLEDIRVAQDLTGFGHYLGNSSLTLTNTFVLDHASLDDGEPQQWTSTYNDHDRGYPVPAEAPTPRVGLQELVPDWLRLTLRWDVALDLHRVRYVAYLQHHPFDFAADPALHDAIRIELRSRRGAGYVDGVGPDRYPYEADLGPLIPGHTYLVLVRAVDELGNQDSNQVVLSAAPGL